MIVQNEKRSGRFSIEGCHVLTLHQGDTGREQCRGHRSQQIS